MAGITNMVTDVKALFNEFLIVKGYQGTVNANDNGKVIIVANGKPGMAPSDIDSLKQKADELDQQLEKLTDKMEEIIATQDQALDNIEPQTQAANATNAEVIKIKKEVEQAQDNLMQAQQTVATLEKKIQADNIDITGCHAGFAVGYNFCIAVFIDIDCALVAYDFDKLVN
jgi:cytochrome c556